MRNLYRFAVLLTVLVVAVTSEECPWGKKKLIKKIKQYHKQCLEKGFESSLGCESEDGKLKKKALKKCGKLERIVKKCGYECAIDGSWSDFGAWSECSAACGGGTQTRTRTCSKPAPANGGADCDGLSDQEQACNVQACKTYTVRLSCDDFMTVYVDGVQKHADKSWQAISSINVPETAQVIAVMCHNGGGEYGIVGVVRDNDGKEVMVTGSAWRCSGAMESGWERPEFHEGGNWKTPMDRGDGHFMRTNSPWNQLTAANRRVIWSSGGAGDTTAYCRVKLN